MQRVGLALGEYLVECFAEPIEDSPPQQLRWLGRHESLPVLGNRCPVRYQHTCEEKCRDVRDMVGGVEFRSVNHYFLHCFGEHIGENWRGFG